MGNYTCSSATVDAILSGNWALNSISCLCNCSYNGSRLHVKCITNTLSAIHFYFVHYIDLYENLHFPFWEPPVPMICQGDTTMKCMHTQNNHNSLHLYLQIMHCHSLQHLCIQDQKSNPTWTVEESVTYKLYSKCKACKCHLQPHYFQVYSSAAQQYTYIHKIK